MGKKIAKSRKESTGEAKEEVAGANQEELKVVEPSDELNNQLYESDLIKLKKENQKQMEKHVSKLDTVIKQKIDLK